MSIVLLLMALFAFGFHEPLVAWLPPLRAAVAVVVFVVATSGHRLTANGGGIVIAFMAWVLAITILHGRLSLGMLFAAVASAALFALGQRVPKDQSIRVGLVIFAVMTILLTAVSLLRPSSDSLGHAIYFVGGKNALALTFLPLIFLLHVQWKPQDRTLRTVRVVSLMLAGATVTLAGSATGKVMVLGYLSFVVHKGRVCRRWQLWLLSIPLIHVALVSGWLLQSSGWARAFVEDRLGKSADFTNRSVIWAAVWERVRQEPLGEGRGYSFLGQMIPGINEAHNMLLEALITAGWPCLIVLLFIMADQMRNSATLGSGGAGVYFVWLAGVVGSMESYTYQFGFWLLLGLAGAASVPTSDVSPEITIQADNKTSSASTR